MTSVDIIYVILKDYKNENDYTDYKIRASSSIFSLLLHGLS